MQENLLLKSIWFAPTSFQSCAKFQYKNNPGQNSSTIKQNAMCILVIPKSGNPHVIHDTLILKLFSILLFYFKGTLTLPRVNGLISAKFDFKPSLKII